MKISKGYGEMVRIGLTIFLAVILYELVIVQLLGNKGYDLRVGRLVFLFSPQWQLLPIILVSIFIVYFIGEYKFQYKRVGRNLLILLCGVSLLVLLFLFARHLHFLYHASAHKFDSIPKGIGMPNGPGQNPALHLLKIRNILLGIDAVLALAMIYLWYNWSEVPVKK
ncbi:hypothetical protein [Flavihumibacter fluvii]|uniref:hypothetical protein n=1 Tax=Flavihumibacter fluvii TaxID=2838157 RepID=UPI001BDF198F|nr:hypothetical protein [Flavihumibacter fluvii]ULQ50870.1 hypothetical protein KJS93_12325 [Flavihumibacter fluvii]